MDALRTFDYIGRRYKGDDKQMEAKMRLARTAIELEQYARLKARLTVKGQKVLPKKFHDQLSAVQADVDIHRGKVDDAIINLEHAVQIAKKKKDRIRWSFILAQLYQLKGQEDKAIAMYNKVAHMGAPYEMGFHAQIFQALAFDRGDSKSLRQKLARMLRDEKNVDHFDIIPLCIGRPGPEGEQAGQCHCPIEDEHTLQHRRYPPKSQEFPEAGRPLLGRQKYPPAQQYYDSTSTLLAEEHPRFDEVKTRAEVLGDLVVQLNVIAREDSLQAFAKLDPEGARSGPGPHQGPGAREEVDKQAADDARDLVASTPLTPKTPGSPGSGGAWYFYNPTQSGPRHRRLQEEMGQPAERRRLAPIRQERHRPRGRGRGGSTRQRGNDRRARPRGTGVEKSRQLPQGHPHRRRDA
ncbi:MAG: tetratricopeptide repeat protein [Flavobacteriales bacterium]|nr:tetratricopeptide repeat protein [Flavobacteriales bacterium]